MKAATPEHDRLAARVDRLIAMTDDEFGEYLSGVDANPTAPEELAAADIAQAARADGGLDVGVLVSGVVGLTTCTVLEFHDRRRRLAARAGVRPADLNAIALGFADYRRRLADLAGVDPGEVEALRIVLALVNES